MTDRRNTGKAEQAMRVALIAWMAERRGTDVRVIHELALGNRRVDLAFVYASDIVGIEIKGPRDSIGDGRLDLQMREYNFYLPEVWLAVHPKWRDHPAVIYHSNLLVVFPDGTIINKRIDQEPDRDELCCSRLIERLWDGEARAIARRLGLIQPQLLEVWPGSKVRAVLARLLCGQEIMRECCRELRARPLTGIGSDPAHERGRPGPAPAFPAHRAK
jgi:hypothetical protein